MKHIIEKWQEKPCDSALWNFYFKDLRVGVLDIETTGLNPARNKFILGCLHDVDRGELHQVLAESRSEEEEALDEYMEILDRMDAVVTYNGKHFDMPFIARRYGNVYHPLPYDLDLYQVLHKHSDLRKILPNLKQKTLENYMGLWNSRADEIDGGESVRLYNHYENTGDSDAEAKILLHNNDDVRQLTRLTEVIKKSDFHRAMFDLGFPVKARDAEGRDHLLEISKVRIKAGSLLIEGNQIREAISYMGFEYKGRPAELTFRGNAFRIELPLLMHQGLTIIDLEEVGLAQGESLHRYPLCSEGFLVIHDGQELKYREINHFVITFIKSFFETEV